MGIFISLQKENGSQMEGIGDPTNILHRVLPQGGDDVLSGIDWYGDTVFNSQQMARFRSRMEDVEVRPRTLKHSHCFQL